MKKVLFSIFVLAACYYAGYAQDWKLRKQSKNVKVYTAEVEGSSYKSVRVECMVKGKFSQVIAALYDLERQKEWVYNDKYSKLLKQDKPNEMIYYSEVSVPWPASNRDLIAHLTVTQTAPNVVVITSHAEPSFVPEKDGLVRIKTSSATWTMTALGSNIIRIDYIITFDPGGSVPGWVINMFITKGPYETFAALQDRMNLPEYQNMHYDFIKD